MIFKNSWILGLLCVLFWSCNNQQRRLDRQAREAFEEQAQIDEQILSTYMEENNISAERTASGLYYQTIETGTGITTQVGDSVSLHYTGNLLYGKTFDSSYFRDTPLGVRIGQTSLIAGFIEGLLLMNKGQRTIFYIPSGLGYGTQGNAQTISINGITQPVQSIPPNAILVFEVEMLDIIP